MCKMSGYEKMVCDIGIRIGLHKKNKINEMEIMIIDEGFSNGDEKSIGKLELLNEIIRENYRKCVIITHMEKVKNRIDKVIRVKKERESEIRGEGITQEKITIREYEKRRREEGREERGEGGR